MDAFSSLAIVGAGKVGSTLARFFRTRGLAIDAIISRRIESARELVEEIDAGKASGSLRDLPASITSIFISVPDDEIRAVAEEIASSSTLDRVAVVVHTSGCKTSDELESLRARGILTASMHPIQMFYTKAVPAEILFGISAGIEGDDAALKVVETFCAQLGWRAIRIHKEKKPLYHAASVFASNYLTLLNATAAALLSASSDEKNVDAHTHFLPIMQTTLSALIESTPEKALTGPVRRGDIEAVRSHLHHLRTLDPRIAHLYTAAASMTIPLALQTNSISPAIAEKLHSLLKDNTTTS